MPHFENLEQYEAKNPKSGEKKIIPIAPHSLQAGDYRPRKRAQSQRESRETAPPFPDVEVEPVSVEEMEREFRIANRKLNRRGGRRGLKSLRLRLLNWLKGLFTRKKKPSGGDRRSRSRRPQRGGRPRKDNRQNQPRQQRADNKGAEGGQSSKRRRRRRPRGGQQGQQPEGGDRQKPDREANKGSQGEGGKQGGGRSRNRRNRRRGPRGGNQGNSGSGNAQ
jgi:hypothetical protein